MLRNLKKSFFLMNFYTNECDVKCLYNATVQVAVSLQTHSCGILFALYPVYTFEYALYYMLLLSVFLIWWLWRLTVSLEYKWNNISYCACPFSDRCLFYRFKRKTYSYLKYHEHGPQYEVKSWRFPEKMMHKHIVMKMVSDAKGLLLCKFHSQFVNAISITTYCL